MENGAPAERMRERTNIVALLREEKPTLICAPMVRYSKLAFRKLVRKYETDVTFTPMILANSFIESEKARNVEFTTDSDDSPLIVQFAASNSNHMAKAAEFVHRYSDGIDLNCGCPQRWAMAEGYGSKLIYRPEVVSDIVKQTRRTISDPQFAVSIKIRIQDDLSKTIDLCQQAESCGADFLSVHARTPQMRHEPVVESAYSVIKDSIKIPLVANGDVFSLDEAYSIAERTGVNGIMSARGILHNPALFAGYEYPPLECIRDWVDICLECGANMTNFHHHLMFMLDRHLTKAEKKIFNRLQSIPAVLDYLNEHFGI